MTPCCKDLYTIPGSWKHPSSCMASIHTGHVTHWACLGCSGSACTTACSSSCQYPATSHIHWRGVDQHSTDHNQQPDELYAKEMCCTAWGKWWSHQILTGFQKKRSFYFKHQLSKTTCLTLNTFLLFFSVCTGHRRHIKEINENGYRLYRYQHVDVDSSLCLWENMWRQMPNAPSFHLYFHFLLIVKWLIKMFTSINLALRLQCANLGANACLCDIHWLVFMV